MEPQAHGTEVETGARQSKEIKVKPEGRRILLETEGSRDMAQPKAQKTMGEAG